MTAWAGVRQSCADDLEPTCVSLTNGGSVVIVMPGKHKRPDPRLHVCSL